MLPRNVRMTNSYTDEFRNELKILALSLEKLNCVGHSLGSGLGTIGEFPTEKLLHDLAEGLRCQNRLHRLILIRDLSKRAGGRGERTKKIREWNTVFMLVKSGIKAKWKTCLINWEYGMQYFGTCFAWNSKSTSIPISPSRRDCKRNFNLFFIQTVEFWSFYDTPPPPHQNFQFPAWVGYRCSTELPSLRYTVSWPIYRLQFFLTIYSHSMFMLVKMFWL